MDNQNRVSKILGMVFGIMGLGFSIMGAVFLFTPSSVSVDPELKMVGMVFFPIGCAFLLGGLCGFLVAYSRKKKAQRLMRDGLCYDADIVRIYDNYKIHINYRSPFIVECGYRDERGRSYLVKSGNIWRTSFMVRESDVRARVWVNPDNPKDYYVEVYNDASGASPNMKFDFDYR